MYAIVDANNFYASCERLFNPALAKTPIVVLSNNDGCVIARSNEAKALGLKMGEPYFQIKHLVNKHAIKVFSSNYAFYGDMSNRIMTVLESNWPETEVYSIDEAFLCLNSLPQSQHTFFVKITVQLRYAYMYPTHLSGNRDNYKSSQVYRDF